jgi:hemerythrin HHE cation binding domain-containing protein
MSIADRERLTSQDATRLFEADRRIAELAGSLRHTQGLGELARSLRHLRFTLEVHFASEEAPDGFFDMLRDRAAANVARVEHLRHDHVMFLRDVDLIQDRVRACLAGPVAELMRQAAALADRVEQHEKRESDLLGEAMSTDVGAEG